MVVLSVVLIAIPVSLLYLAGKSLKKKVDPVKVELDVLKGVVETFNKQLKESVQLREQQDYLSRNNLTISRIVVDNPEWAIKFEEGRAQAAWN